MAGPALVGILLFTAIFFPALCFPYHDMEHCFDGKMLPVNIEKTSPGLNCYDKEGNKYPEKATLLSCCGCLKLTCKTYTTTNPYPTRVSNWTLTRSDSCCEDCHGSVFPTGAIMSVEEETDSCKTTRTTRCVYVDVNAFTMDATCDNNMRLFADGRLVATSNDWTTSTAVFIPGDTKVIEIECEDTGVIGGILASANNGLKTDETWSCSSDGGVTWNYAYEIHENNKGWAHIKSPIDGISTDAKWIWSGESWDKDAKRNVSCKTKIGYKGEAVVEVSFDFKECCSDDTGNQPIDFSVLEKKTCSKRTCDRFEGNKFASWVSNQEKEGCNCCLVVVNGKEELISDGEECPGVKNSKCCQGTCMVPAVRHETLPSGFL